jgi:molecular chaperone DnaK (HSP70)
MNPRMTVFDAKRLIGRRFDDSDVKKDMVHWPFTVIEKEGNPFIQVCFTLPLLACWIVNGTQLTPPSVATRA